MSERPIIACFKSHYSLTESLLTLEEPGKAKPGNAVSVFDLAKEGGLKDVMICDTRIDGAIQAYRTATKLGVKLIYGIKLIVCADMADRDAQSTRKTESKVVVFMRGGPLNAQGLPQGYSDLLRIWSRAWGPEGHIQFRLGGDEYSYGRADWRLLNTFWTPHLLLALPYTSSFLARNTLTFNQITPQLPEIPWVFKEIASDLPQAPLIDAAIDRYVAQEPAAIVQPIKTVCYRSPADMEAYAVLRCIGAGTAWEEGCEGLCSDAFSWEAFKHLAAKGAPNVATV